MSPSPQPTESSAGANASPRYHCRMCGRDHCAVALQPGERAVCTRCGATLAESESRNRGAPLALAVTGLICAGAAALLPVMSAEKFGSENTATVFSGIAALWNEDYPVTASWVAFCSTLAPVLLLALFAGYHLVERFRPASHRLVLGLVMRWLVRWSMPEVQVLAFVVAFAKLGDLVNLTVDPGLWFYSAAALMALLSWRHFDLVPTPAWKSASAA